jgi:hypothetical protein
MGDDKNRALRRHHPHVLLDDALAFIIERGFVEDQDPWLAQECAGNSGALPLTTR